MNGGTLEPEWGPKTAAEAVFCLVSLDKCNKGAYLKLLLKQLALKMPVWVSGNTNTGVVSLMSK